MISHKSKDPLVSVLYSLLRDHVQPGDLEHIVQDLNKIEPGDITEFTNGYLAQYAEDLAGRIRNHEPRTE